MTFADRTQPAGRGHRTPVVFGLRPPCVLGDLDVLRLLLRRHVTGSAPGARSDGHRLALVLGGGGMRGAYPAGMVRALEKVGLRAGFDQVYGASSGAFGGAAFLAGAAEAGAACYPEDLASASFIDVRRLGTGRPVLSLDFLLTEVLGNRKPLSWQALCDSPVPLHVVATDAADLRAHTLPATSAGDWERAVRASAAIPLLAGRPVDIDGRRWIDGSIAEPLAIARALRGGATHVLVMLCRGTEEIHPDADAGLSWWARVLDRMTPGLGTLAQGARRYRAELDRITGEGTASGEPQRVLAVMPARSAGVGALSTDADALDAAVHIGDESVMTALDYAATTGAD